jgi:hypothetical protein
MQVAHQYTSDGRASLFQQIAHVSPAQLARPQNTSLHVVIYSALALFFGEIFGLR